MKNRAADKHTGCPDVCVHIRDKITATDCTMSTVESTSIKWDIIEAKNRGFKPHRFEYGLGKDVITPLGDEDLCCQVSPEKNENGTLKTGVVS